MPAPLQIASEVGEVYKSDIVSNTKYVYSTTIDELVAIE